MAQALKQAAQEESRARKALESHKNKKSKLNVASSHLFFPSFLSCYFLSLFFCYLLLLLLFCYFLLFIYFFF